MKHGVLLGVALAAALSVPALAEDGPASVPGAGPARSGGQAQTASPDVANRLPRVAPYPNDNVGDVDGLSRNKQDCNKGCVEGPP